jgi:hypothetical protein
MGIVVAKEREVALKIRESSSKGKSVFTVTTCVSLSKITTDIGN